MTAPRPLADRQRALRRRRCDVAGCDAIAGFHVGDDMTVNCGACAMDAIDAGAVAAETLADLEGLSTSEKFVAQSDRDA